MSSNFWYGWTIESRNICEMLKVYVEKKTASMSGNRKSMNEYYKISLAMK